MFVLRVQLRDSWADVTVHANSLDQAIRLAEAQYGSVLGVISQ